MLDRLGQPALLSEREPPVGVGVGVIGRDLQGALIVVDGVSQLALLGESAAEVILGYRRVGVDSEGMSPKGLRVMPDVDLVPGESSQADGDKDDEPDQQ